MTGVFKQTNPITYSSVSLEEAANLFDVEIETTTSNGINICCVDGNMIKYNKKGLYVKSILPNIPSNKVKDFDYL